MGSFSSLPSRVLTPVAVLAVFTGLAAGAVSANLGAPITPVSQLAVHDARGRVVGIPFELGNDDAVIAVRVGDNLVGLYMRRDQPRFEQWGATIGSQLLFESTDCSGQAYDAHSPADLNQISTTSWFSLAVLNGQNLYSISGAPREITYRSGLNEIDGTTCEATVGTSEQTPVQFLVDLAGAFEPPFSLR
jgi:hypothetical protein